MRQQKTGKGKAKGVGMRERFGFAAHPACQVLAPGRILMCYPCSPIARRQARIACRLASCAARD